MIGSSTVWAHTGPKSTPLQRFASTGNWRAVPSASRFDNRVSSYVISCSFFLKPTKLGLAAHVLESTGTSIRNAERVKDDKCPLPYCIVSKYTYSAVLCVKAATYHYGT